MDHTVIFLVLAGKLVLLDLALSIVVGMGAEHQSVLGASFHSLGIDIVARLLVLHQPAVLLPLGKILHGPVIDLVVMIRQNRVEIYLRLGDVEQGLLTGHLLGFHRVEHIIRRCSHLCHNIFWRPYRRKRFHSYHNRIYLFTWKRVHPSAK